MRYVSLLTAICVAGSLFFLIVKRDEVFALVGRPISTDQEQNEPETSIPDAGTVEVIAFRSVPKPIETGIVLRGLTEAARFVEVRAETSGLVISEPLRKGALVEKGQVICALDPGTRLIELDEAKARLDDAKINERAATSLADEGYGSEASRTAALAALRAASAAVERAETEIKRIEISAPFNGLLETDAAELGTLLQRGSLCATIIQLDPIKLVGFIVEADVDKVEINNIATARLISGKQVQGKVSFISRAADTETRTFRIEITVDNRDLSIRDGSTVEIFIAAGSQNAHFLPQSALTLNETGELGIQTVSGEMAKFVRVNVIRDSMEGVWVTGPDEVTNIIIVGQEYVIDGTPISITYKDS